ncbi:putative membrane protein [Rhizobium sp. PP-F2F-G36]|nr:putative membrane protein [Rhizobium sp. PP-F2F-G36]
MTDLLVLAAFIFSFLAFARTRQANERFTRDIAFLQSEIARLSAAHLPGTLVAGPATDVAVVETQAPEMDEGERSAATIEPETIEAEPASVPPEETEPQKPRESLESWLGARWAVWVGGIALALGGIFLVKVSIDAGLLSPAVRLVLAALFGAALMVGGEMIRRRGPADGGQRFANAMIPGILTAAGAVTLLGAIFAAHAVYGFIGPTTAFILMGLVSFLVLGLSLRHGQALAGLGLAASLVTPLLIDAEDPSPWSLFAFLSLVWLAAMATARIGRWRIVPAFANIGLALWGTVYLIAEDPAVTLPVSLSLLVLIAGHAYVWPAGADDAEPEAIEDAAETLPVAEDTTTGAGAASATPVPAPRRAAHWRRLLLPRHAPIILTGAFAVLMTGLSLIGPLTETDGNPTFEFLAVTAALGFLGALRARAVTAALTAGLMAILGVSTLATLPLLLELSSIGVVAERSFATSPVAALSLAAIFIVLCAFALHRHSDRHRFAILWSGLAAVTSVACIGLSFLILGTYSFDPLHGLAATAAAIAFVTLAEIFARRDASFPSVAQGLLLAGALGQLVVAAHALSDGLWTVLAMAVFAVAFIAATRVRNWAALPWVGALGFVFVLARIGWEPTIVGPLALGRTPVLNALLPGYGIPALFALWSAYTLRDWPSDRLRNTLQAIASLFGLLTLAILVRHAMNGGQLQGGAPSLSEQSIYTLLVIGASAILMRLDLSRPGSFFRYGSIGLGAISLLMTLSAHLVGLNPYLTGELLGPYPLFDLLLIGYLLPGLAYAALARMAVGRRPPAFVAALATAAAVLVFTWATLSVRRAWQGPSIADWKGFLAGETYTYSVVWLALGVLLLVASLRFHSRSMRIVSGVLVFVTVLKVFLFDMANLEGLLRALSFMGLGIVLIGIGLFYQKVLTARPKPAADVLPGSGV